MMSSSAPWMRSGRGSCSHAATWSAPCRSTIRQAVEGAVRQFAGAPGQLYADQLMPFGCGAVAELTDLVAAPGQHRPIDGQSQHVGNDRRIPNGPGSRRGSSSQPGRGGAWSSRRRAGRNHWPPGPDLAGAGLAEREFRACCGRHQVIGKEHLCGRGESPASAQAQGSPSLGGRAGMCQSGCHLNVLSVASRGSR